MREFEYEYESGPESIDWTDILTCTPQRISPDLSRSDLIITTLASPFAKLTLPNPQSYNTELTVEPFRWDQRVFSVILQLPSATADTASATGDNPAAAAATAPTTTTAAMHSSGPSPSSPMTATITSEAANHPLAPISDVTGGTCSIVRSLPQLLQHMEDLVHTRLHLPAVVVDMEPVQGAPHSAQGAPLPAKSLHTAVTVRHMSGFWPIPESYHVHPGKMAAATFPPRSAQPTIHVMAQEYELPAYMDRFHPIMDKYEIDPQCPMARYAVSAAQARIASVTRKTSSGGGGAMPSPSGMGVADVIGSRVYKCFVANSHSKSQLGEPFGFIRCQPSSSSSTSPSTGTGTGTGGAQHQGGKPATSPGPHTEPFVTLLYVLPYNYPRLFYLLEELWKQKLMPTGQWRQDFENYLQQVPFYYIQPLRIALVNRMKLPSHIIPDHIDGQMPYSMAQHLKKLTKQAKVENERLSVMERLHQAQRQKKSAMGASASATTTVTTTTAGTAGQSNVSSRGTGDTSDKDTDFRTLLSGGGAADGSRLASFDTGSGAAQATAASVLDSVVSAAAGPPPSPTADQMRATSPSAPGDGSIASNPFDIPRSQLLAQLVSMKLAMYGKDDNLFERGIQRSREAQQKILKHSIPIAQMGNFDAVLRKKAVLRDPFSDVDLTEWQRKRPNFGSPFQKKKSRRREKQQVLSNFLAVDEAEAGAARDAVDATAVEEVQESPPAPRSPMQSAPDADDLRKPMTHKKSRSGSGRTSVASTNRVISPFDMPSSEGLPLGAPHQRRSPGHVPASPLGSSPPPSPQESHSPRKRHRRAMHGTESPDDSSKKPAAKRLKALRREEDAEVIREMARTVPGILSLPDRIVESIYDRQCHLRFSQLNTQLDQELRRFIRQHQGGGGGRGRQQMETFVMERLAKLSGTSRWKHRYIAQMAQYARAFHKSHLAQAMERYMSTSSSTSSSSSSSSISDDRGGSNKQ